jgi:DNA repair exonuclease SbcCD ATPase subunit
MVNGLENIKSQTQEGENEISKILGKITFNCPHCYKEINETHLDEKGRYFQSIKEKIRRITEEEINSQKFIQKKQLLEQIETERSYEKFGEVIKKDRTIEELLKVTKKQGEEILELKLKSKEDLAKATSYDEIRKLEGFKELERKVEKYQKEIEELKIGNQPEIQTLKGNIKKLEEDLVKEKLQAEKAKSFEELEKLDRVKELKGKVEKYQKESEEKEKRLSELNSSEYIEGLKRVKELVEENKELRNQNQSLRDQGRMSKKKGENFEQYILEELTRVFDDKDKISKITQMGVKADFLQEVLTENGEQVAGRIIYEVKNEKK